jgi:hypothetical protein
MTLLVIITVNKEIMRILDFFCLGKLYILGVKFFQP